MKKVVFPFIAALIIAVAGIGGLNSCKGHLNKTENLMDSIVYNKSMPEWAKSCNIYEVNTRQYTKEGTFKAFQANLPRLKK